MRPLEGKSTMNARKPKALVIVAAIAAGLAAGSARADGAGPYVGGTVGVPHFNDDVNGIGGNGSGVSGKVFGGYEFTPNFALEAGVARLGRVADASGTANGHATYLDAVGLAPLGDKWSLLGSVGASHVNLNTSNGDGSANALKLGVGAEYALSKDVALRGEIERYRPDAFGSRINIDQYTFGVRIGF
jgi:OOP family OmpA-OmpF porin